MVSSKALEYSKGAYTTLSVRALMPALLLLLLLLLAEVANDRTGTSKGKAVNPAQPPASNSPLTVIST